ncbi:MAG: hypothetical protein A3F67_09795 [Verrucomicrobia bacterium RIFCSPHIGHO2_12_FULL_41_10]|nr:MAG: hypothetical protein A3F67_09795 [Verrucomicrobia bacterium RIFCSPHIGHO2_12_FULL_41_10]
MHILGISAYYHDSAVALVQDGKIVAAAQEERFSRKKHDASFPHGALQYCLSQLRGGLGAADYIVFYEKPLLKLERLVETYAAYVPRGFSSFSKTMSFWWKHKAFQREHILKELKQYYPYSPVSDLSKKLLFSEHHISHAASAFFPSPFVRAAVITVDGVGEWTTTGIFLGKQNILEPLQEIRFPHSLGLLYSAVTYYLGFKVNSDEYKIMGLAPYGEPRYQSLFFDHVIDLKEDGSFRLNQDYFDYCIGTTMLHPRWEVLFKRKRRQPQDSIESFHMDVAASIQVVCEEVMVRIARFAAQKTQSENVCLAGGVALNCVANGRIAREGIFKNIWIQPAAGDAGGAVGAALSAYYMYAGNVRDLVNTTDYDAMQGAYLGPDYSEATLLRQLTTMGLSFQTLTDEVLIDTVVRVLVEGKVVGWMQGRMEWGPRALGNRSILADPRIPDMQKTLNLKVKNRESFRPFAPVVLEEDASDWFVDNTVSPYMLLVSHVKEVRRTPITSLNNPSGIEKIHVQRSEIPAVTHVDYSARLQTVNRQTNPRLYALLTAFKQKTGCPMLVNTSFNVADEPIVESPKDAIHCFLQTQIDFLVIGNYLLEKNSTYSTIKK